MDCFKCLMNYLDVKFESLGNKTVSQACEIGKLEVVTRWGGVRLTAR